MDASIVVATFGDKLKKLSKGLMDDEELCKLLFYSDSPLKQENVDNKNEEILNKHIILNTDVPYNSDKGSYILITVNNLFVNTNNNKTVNVEIYVDILVPTTDWNYGGPSLRPFAILGKVIETFKNIKIQGVGKLDFEEASLAVSANNMSGYTAKFTNYDLGV